MEIKQREYMDESDIPFIVDLYNLCEENDRQDEGSSIEEMQLIFSHPHFDVKKDLSLWEDENGAIVAIGYFDPLDCYLQFKVLPSSRGKGIEEEILAWGEMWIGSSSGNEPEAGGNPGPTQDKNQKLCIWVRDDNSTLLNFLKDKGFKANRYYLCLSRSLEEVIPEADFPEDLKLRPLNGELESEQWVKTYNEVFSDHWNHHPWKTEDFIHWLTDTEYRPDLNLVLATADGTLIGFCWCEIYREENNRNKRQDGWISLLGMHRTFRKRGIGKAMLLSGLTKLKDAGMNTALLYVDSLNLTNATKLYEEVGFKLTHTWLSMCK